VKRNVVNKMYLLKLFQEANKNVCFEKIMLMAFIMQTEGRKEEYPTFNYEFRNLCVPYSEELKEDLALLLHGKLIKKNRELYGITEKGENVLKQANRFIVQSFSKKFMKPFIVLHLDSPLDEFNTYVEESYELVQYEFGERLDSIISEDEMVRIFESRRNKIRNMYFQEAYA